MGVIENSKTEVGSFARNFQISSDVGTLEFVAEYTAYVKAFMEQKGKSSKPHKLHPIDTRRCKFYIKGLIELQIFVYGTDGELDEFGPIENVKTDDFFLRLSSDTSDFSSLEAALFEIGSRILGLGSFHNPCSKHRKRFRQDRLKAIAMMQGALSDLKDKLDNDPNALDNLVSSLEMLEKVKAYSHGSYSYVDATIPEQAVFNWTDSEWIIDVADLDE